MTNWDVYRILLYTSKLLLLSGRVSEAKIYEKSAYSVAALDYSIRDASDVIFLPDSIRNDIEEILTTGTFSYKNELELRIPKGITSLLKLPYLSPENVAALYANLGIASISELQRAVETHRIKKSKGFGMRFEEQVKKSLLSYRKDSNELTLFDAFSYANSVKRLLSNKGILKIEVAGSVRRGKEKVNDLNFVVNGKNVSDIIKSAINYKKIEKETSEFLYLKDWNNIRLKFLIVPEMYFCSALLFYTGSKLHNLKIKEIASVKGYKFSRQGYVMIKANNEEAVYNRLGLQYIPPEIREGNEEVELAKRKAIPKLIEYSDVLGDLHVHSNFSDGTNDINEIKEESILHGYRYIAITDHSKSLRIANGLNRNAIIKELNIIDRLNREREIKLLKGSEIEIRKDGALDFEDDLLERLDVRVAAMHSGFEDRKRVTTQRLKKALSNRFVNILAHPTGRLISFREGFDFDVEKIFKLAVINNVALEINVFPKRMDLPVSLIKYAKRLGVKYFSVGTDAHNVGHLNFMRYGVKILRRAFLTKDEVINSFDLNELEKFLWTKRH